MNPQPKLGRHFSISLRPFPQGVHIFSLSNTPVQYLSGTFERGPTGLTVFNEPVFNKARMQQGTESTSVKL